MYSSKTTGKTPASRYRLFSALRHRDFRYLWGAFVAAMCAQRMDGVVLGWLVLELTDSAFLVGLSGSLRFLGATFGPMTGVVADRYNRRRLIMTVLVAMTMVVIVLFMLVLMRRLEVWHLFVATTLWGLLWAFYQPAQQSMQADILSGSDLVNGISLMNGAMNLTSIVGPALAGALLACCGAATLGKVASAGMVPGVRWAYGVFVALHVVQFVNYWALREGQYPTTSVRTSVLHNLLDGLRYSRSNPGLWTPLVLAALVNLLAFPLQFGLLPVFARDVFHVGAAELGLLGAALGVGSLLGSLLMIVLGTLSRASRLMLIGTLGWLLFLIGFGLTSNYQVALLILVMMGISQTLCLTNIAVMLLGTASSEMRGRIMGLRSMAVAPLFLGGTLAGAVATYVGVALTTLIFAAIGILMTLWVLPWIPRQPGQQRE